MLLKYGADKLIQNKDGKTAYDIARLAEEQKNEPHRQRILELLRP